MVAAGWCVNGPDLISPRLGPGERGRLGCRRRPVVGMPSAGRPGDCYRAGRCPPGGHLVVERAVLRCRDRMNAGQGWGREVYSGTGRRLVGGGGRVVSGD